MSNVCTGVAGRRRLPLSVLCLAAALWALAPAAMAQAGGATSGNGQGPAAPVAPAASAPAAPASGGGGAKSSLPTNADVKDSIARGDTKPYECTYILPKGLEPGGPFCPGPKVASALTAKGGSVLTPENGDIVVVINAADYFAALKAMDGKPPRLSLNGLDMAAGARQDGWDQDAKFVRLRFGVTQGDVKGARDFWSSIYQRVGFGALTPLHVALGWEDNPNYFRAETDDGLSDELFVTSRTRMAIAAILGLAIVGGFLWALKGSDIFRIGRRLDTGDRQAYSFSRVQWGLWTTFAVAAAVFLWAVYGIFLPLSPTVLQLVGVSTLAATTSFFMDSSNSPVPEKSVNFWVDLLSGSNDTTAQAHRFQALAVNTVLLVGAIYEVYQHLGYPNFDSTWLAMLGISDAGQLAGKQLLEKQGTAQPGSLPVATLPPAPTGTAPPPPATPPALPPASLPPGPP